MLGAQTDAAPGLYMQQMQMPQQGIPSDASYMQQAPLPQSAVPGVPQVPEKSSSPRSSDGKDDEDYAKLQERIQKQKEKNARNQRQFRKRVSGQDFTFVSHNHRNRCNYGGMIPLEREEHLVRGSQGQLMCWHTSLRQHAETLLCIAASPARYGIVQQCFT